MATWWPPLLPRNPLTKEQCLSVFPTKKPTHDQCCVVAMSTTTATASAAASIRSKVPPLCSPSITPNQVSIHLRHFFPLCAAAVLLCLASAAILCFVLAVPLHFALHFPFPSCNFFCYRFCCNCYFYHRSFFFCPPSTFNWIWNLHRLVVEGWVVKRGRYEADEAENCLLCVQVRNTKLFDCIFWNSSFFLSQ